MDTHTKKSGENNTYLKDLKNVRGNLRFVLTMKDYI
jgi:hypothetical protein